MFVECLNLQAYVQEHGCRALYSLAFEEGNKKRIGTAGGVQVVLAALSAHTTDECLVEAALRTITSLAGALMCSLRFRACVYVFVKVQCFVLRHRHYLFHFDRYTHSIA